MDKKKQLLLSIGLVLILVLMIVGISYAAFKFVGLGNKPNTITTGAITMEYEESTNTISMTGALPTTDATGKVRLTDGEYFDFTIKSSIKGNANINWEIAAEDITASAKKMNGKNIKLYLTKLDSAGAETQVMAPKVYNASTSANTKTGRPSGVMSLATGTMSTSETTNYRLRMYVDEDYNPQGDGGDLSFSVKINAYGKVKQAPTGSKIKAYMTQADLENDNYPGTDFHTGKSVITSIITKNDNIVPATAVASWDISEAGDGSVMAYVEKTDELLPAEPSNAKIYSNDEKVNDISKTIYATPLSETNTNYAYKLTIGGKDGIIANESMIGYFAGFNKITSIDLSALDTSEVTNMNGMFSRCSRLTSLDISNFDTSKVTGMSNMFSGCSVLTSLDLSKFDTSNVVDMSFMFYNIGLTNLDVSNFDTSKVTNMHYMFGGGEYYQMHIEEINVKNFDTSKVTDMSFMFSNCKSLTSLDLRNFNTSQVTNMASMFGGCSSLTSLDVSKLNTSQVTDMSAMFSGCSSLTNLDVSKLNTPKVTNMASMFGGCSSLTSLDVSKLNTSKVTNMASMFGGCSSLTSLDVSKLNTSQVTDMSAMFSGCSSLTSLDVSKLNTSKVTYVSYMFAHCSSLTSLNVSNFDTSKVTRMNGMFSSCSSLTSLDLRNFNTSNVTAMNSMFSGCSSLTSLDLRSFDTSKTENFSYMFNSCSKLTQINVSDKWVMGSSIYVTDMFYNCGTNRLITPGGSITVT